MISKQTIMLGAILFSYVILISVPIHIVVGDLGRHIKNGEIIVNTFSIPKTNLFTYTNTNFPFINHHWGTGVIFYLINNAVGLTVLHIFMIFISLLTFFLFFDIAWKYSNFYLASLISILILPLLASRPDLRPEMFSNFFSGIFFWILFNYKMGKIGPKYLFLLPFIQFLWVNLHIYFFLGLMILTAFNIEAFIQHIKKRPFLSYVKNFFFITLCTSFITTLLNPSGIDGTLYPLRIFNNYGYNIDENTSVLQDLLRFTSHVSFFPTVIMFLLSSLLVIIQSIKYRKPIHIAPLLIGLVITSLSLMSIRNFAILGYFLLPIISLNIITLFLFQSQPLKKRFLFSLKIMLVLLVSYHLIFVLKGKISLNINVAAGEEKAGQFYVQNNIQGPVFNNFNIGGYLVSYLYPKQLIFIDNRPEAVPASFFKDVYLPILEQDRKWQEALEKYKFNVIFFDRLDRTKPTLNFLLSRIKDPEWEIVFVNTQSIIFLKKNEVNNKMIDNYKISKDAILIYASSIEEVSHKAIF